MHIWKQELGALAPVEVERERLEREKSQTEGRRTALESLEAQVGQWQECLKKIQAGQSRRQALEEQKAALGAELLEKQGRLQADRETLQALSLIHI